MKSIYDHGRKHHVKKCWCHNTVLFDPLRSPEMVPSTLHHHKHVIIELLHQCYRSECVIKVLKHKTCMSVSSEIKIGLVVIYHSVLYECVCFFHVRFSSHHNILMNLR